MARRPPPAAKGFARDFGIASLVAIPLIAAGAGAYVYWQAATLAPDAPEPVTVALAGPSETGEAEAVAAPSIQARAPAPIQTPAPAPAPAPAPETVVPFFEIVRAAAPAASSPVAATPAPAAAVPRASDAGWEARAVRPPQIRAGAWIAIVIDDLGVDPARAARTMALPGPLTLSFLSYAPDLAEQGRQGRAAGHEIMLHLPMEPEGRDNPGPGALFVRMSADDIRARTANALDRLPNAVGLNNHMGSRFTREPAALAPVLQEIAARGLLFVDSRTTGNSAGSSVAQSLGVAHAARDVFLDNEIEAGAVRKQLAELERVANRRGTAVAIGHPHDATLEALATWIPTMNSRGLQLVPVSAVVRQQRQAPASPNLAPVALREATALPQSQPASTRAATVTRAIPEPAAAVAGEPPWKRYPTE
jgi:uncharacterized protein